ncbi:MAG: STAS-like domain-containing protein [Bacteroidales bacterium]|nr:STAS-like domain-containing protein [Bacteroidales bacterium]MBQ6726822.1 STAS-like domain-containing protein [Bacteroidales bacterium]
MVTFSFLQFGEDLGTRQLGQRARELLVPLIEQNDLVVLDFTGVNVVSNSFADECIAKILLTMPLDELKKHTTFRGLNPIASESVLTALQRRYISISK